MSTTENKPGESKTVEQPGPVIIERTFDAPVVRVWKAITDPVDLKQWYFDLPAFKAEVGYEFEFAAGPDEKKYRHLCKVTRVNPEKVLSYSWRYDGYEGDSEVTFELFSVTKEQTRLKLTHEGLELFPAAKNSDLAKDNFVHGWTEIIGSSLKAYLEKSKPAFELEFERVISASRERVWEAWTKPEQMAQWFAPKPYKLIIHKMDFSLGGRFSMAMRGPDGNDFPFTGTYREIIPPAKLVWTGEFSTGPADQMTTIVTFEEQGQKTKVHARQTFHVMTPEIENALKGAKEGWTMTLNQLAAFCTR